MGKLATVILLLTASAVAAEDRLNKTIQLLERNQPVFGGFVFDLSDETAIHVARSGLDYAIIDLEHRPYDVSAAKYNKADVVQ